ncbi:MAG: polysaccharide biosynthesis protein [Lachnospiraceae bacterium]|nr:polysaccharide biosynthesis protein [Lachnospiraceae bacterium]
MANSGKKVVKQASFLMAAQITSSVIGLLYRTPLHLIMGDDGDGYYSYAYDWYAIILIIASYSIPSAVSKVMAERLARKEYKNAARVFQAALLFVLIVGGGASLFTFFAAPLLLSKQPNAVPALRILAPVIFLSGVLGVFRGFFQAHNKMAPTAISQILEQILNAVFSVVMAYFLTGPYRASGADSTLIGRYGAAGGTIGTGAGVVTGLIVILFVFYANRSFLKRRLREDRSRSTETLWTSLRAILLMVVPILLATTVYNMVNVIDQQLYTNLEILRGIDRDAVNRAYGLFGYRCRPIINIPIAMASATSAALIPAIATSMAAGRKSEAGEKISECIRFVMFLAIPAATGLAILSYGVIFILYPGGDIAGAARLLTIGAVSVVFYSLSTVSNGVLQGSGHPMLPVRNTLIAIGVNVLSLLLFTGVFRLGVNGLVLSTVLFAVAASVLNLMAVRKRLSFKTDIRNTFLIPVISSALMGVVLLVFFWLPKWILPGFFGHYGGNVLITIVSVVTGVLSYFIAYVRLSGITEAELREFPLGGKIVRVLRLLHVPVRSGKKERAPRLK